MEIYALDGLDQLDIFHDHVAAQFTERKLGVGGWRLEVPVGVGSTAAAKLAAATWAGIEVWDPDTQFRYGGYLTSIEISRRADLATIVFAGNDFQTELQNRLDWPDTDDVSDWWRHIVGGLLPLTTEARTIVDKNAGPSAQAFRQLAGIQFEAVDPAAGSAPARRLKGLPVLQVLAELMAGQSHFGRLRLDRPDTIPIPGARLLFETPEVVAASTALSVEQGDVETLRLTDRADRATYLIGMGAENGGSPGERHVATRSTAATGWRTRHKEAFHNRPGTDTLADLGSELDSLLAAAVGGYRAKVEGVQVRGYGPAGDLDLGFQVPVSIGEGTAAVTELLNVNASTLTYTTDREWVRTVDLGDEELTGTAAVRNDLARLTARVREIESELTT